MLSSADPWRRRTSLEWVPLVPKWWWPRPTWNLWTAKAGGRPYSAAPAWSTVPPGGLGAFSDAPVCRGERQGPERSRRRGWDRWMEWDGGGRRRAGRGTRGTEGKRDQNVSMMMSFVVFLSPFLPRQLYHSYQCIWHSSLTNEAPVHCELVLYLYLYSPFPCSFLGTLYQSLLGFNVQHNVCSLVKRGKHFKKSFVSVIVMGSD